MSLLRLVEKAKLQESVVISNLRRYSECQPWGRAILQLNAWSR